MPAFSTDHFILNSIGLIQTPYIKSVPYQPVQDTNEDFKIVLKDKYKQGLKALESFTYIYIIYYLDKVQRSNKYTISPPWAKNKSIGIFASRSPNRPNPIGISVVKLLKIEGNTLYISGIDALNNTPLLDIKPYIDKLDAKEDANFGWVNTTDDKEHLALHIKGLPHEH